MDGRAKTLSVMPSHQVACLPPKGSPTQATAWIREQCSQDHTSSALRESALTVETHPHPTPHPTPHPRRGSALGPWPFPGRTSAVFILLLLNSYSAFVAERPPAPPPLPTFSVDRAYSHANSDVFLQYPARVSQTRGGSTAHFTKIRKRISL